MFLPAPDHTLVYRVPIGRSSGGIHPGKGGALLSALQIDIFQDQGSCLFRMAGLNPWYGLVPTSGRLLRFTRCTSCIEQLQLSPGPWTCTFPPPRGTGTEMWTHDMQPPAAGRGPLHTITLTRQQHTARSLGHVTRQPAPDRDRDLGPHIP